MRVTALIRHYWSNGGVSNLSVHHTDTEWLAKDIIRDKDYGHDTIIVAIEKGHHMYELCDDVFDRIHKINKYRRRR